MTNPELAPMEKEVWRGRPSPLLFAMASFPVVKLGAVWVIGGLFFCVFAFGVPAAADEVWPCLLPLVASVIGLGMIGTFPFRYMRSQRLRYYLTSSRAIVYDCHRRQIVESYNYVSYPDAEAFPRANGCCDIIFKTEFRPTSNEEPSGIERAATVKKHGLIGVEDGVAAMEAFEDLRKGFTENP